MAVHMVLHELSLIRATILFFNGTSSSDRSGLCTLHHAFQLSEDIHATVRLASQPKIRRESLIYNDFSSHSVISKCLNHGSYLQRAFKPFAISFGLVHP